MCQLIEPEDGRCCICGKHIIVPFKSDKWTCSKECEKELNKKSRNSEQVLDEFCTCGGLIKEQIYQAHEKEIYFRIICIKCGKEYAFENLCPQCMGIMKETKEQYDDHNDCEYTKHVCTICNNYEWICSFEPEN